MRPLFVSLLLLPSVASAAWPEDVTLSGMTEHDGRPVFERDTLAADYQQLIRELGTAVGTRSLLPAQTLGAAGFAFEVDTLLSFPTFRTQEDGPSPWQRADADEDPGAVIVQPGITVRKGLPFSLEVGVTGRWLGGSRQGVFSGFLRAGLVEGYKPFPDVNVHLGYTGYVGNDELELGVFDVGVTIGSTFAVGPGEGARNAKITPYVDFTLLTISAAPVVDEDTAVAIGASTFGSTRRNPYPSSTTTSRPIAVPTFNGGLQFVFGKVMVRLTGGYGLRSVPHAGASVGFVY